MLPPQKVKYFHKRECLLCYSSLIPNAATTPQTFACPKCSNILLHYYHYNGHLQYSIIHRIDPDSAYQIFYYSNKDIYIDQMHNLMHNSILVKRVCPGVVKNIATNIKEMHSFFNHHYRPFAEMEI